METRTRSKKEMFIDAQYQHVLNVLSQLPQSSTDQENLLSLAAKEDGKRIKDALDKIYASNLESIELELKVLELKGSPKKENKESIELQIELSSQEEINRHLNIIFYEMGKAPSDSIDNIKESLDHLGIPSGNEIDESFFAKQFFAYNQINSFISPLIGKLKIYNQHPKLAKLVEENLAKCVSHLSNDPVISSGALVAAANKMDEIMHSLADSSSSKETISDKLAQLGIEATEENKNDIFIENYYNLLLLNIPCLDASREELEAKSIADKLKKQIEKSIEENKFQEFLENFIYKFKKIENELNAKQIFDELGIEIDSELASTIYAEFHFQRIVRNESDMLIRELLKRNYDNVTDSLRSKNPEEMDKILNNIRDKNRTLEELQENVKEIGLNSNMAHVIIKYRQKKEAENNNGNMPRNNRENGHYHYQRILEAMEHNSTKSSFLHKMLILHEQEVKKALSGKSREAANKLVTDILNETDLEKIKPALKNAGLDNSDEKAKSILAENQYRIMIDNTDILPANSTVRNILEQVENSFYIKNYIASFYNDKAIGSLISTLRTETQKETIEDLLKAIGFSAESSKDIAESLSTENKNTISKCEETYLISDDHIKALLKKSETAFYSANQTDVNKCRDDVNDMLTSFEKYLYFIKVNIENAKDNNKKEELNKKLIDIEHKVEQLNQIKTDLSESTPSGSLNKIAYFSDKVVFVENNPASIKEAINNLTEQANNSLGEGILKANSLSTSGGFDEQKARITCSTFGFGDKSQIAIGVQTKKSGTTTASCYFYGKSFDTSRTGWFPSLPNDTLLAWANIQIKDFIAAVNPSQRDKGINISGKFPSKDHLEAILLMCAHHKIPCANATSIKIDINDEKLAKLNQRIQKNSELLRENSRDEELNDSPSLHSRRF